MCSIGVVCFSRIGVQSETPSPHRGASCLSNLFEKLSGWRWSRNCFKCCGSFFGMFSRFFALISANSLEAARRLIAICGSGFVGWVCAPALPLLCYGRMIGPEVLGA